MVMVMVLRLVPAVYTTDDLSLSKLNYKGKGLREGISKHIHGLNTLADICCYFCVWPKESTPLHNYLINFIPKHVSRKSENGHSVLFKF